MDRAPRTMAWLNLTEPAIAHALGSRFDVVCVDEQHGAATPAATPALVAAIRAAGGHPAVRVAWNRPELIGRALDSGAGTVIVPMVDDVEQARAAADAARFPPRGTRSFGGLRGAYEVVLGAGALEAEVRLLVMIETPTALEHLDAIAATPGIDGLFVGPFDLSIALGLPLDDLVADAGGPLTRIATAARAHGILAAGYAGSPERARALRGHGFELLASVSDTDLLRAGAERAAAEAREGLG